MLKKLQELQRSNLSNQALATYLQSVRAPIDAAASSRIINYLRMLDSDEAKAGGASDMNNAQPAEAPPAVAVLHQPVSSFDSSSGISSDDAILSCDKAREAVATLLGLSKIGGGSEKENDGGGNKRKFDSSAVV